MENFNKKITKEIKFLIRKYDYLLANEKYDPKLKINKKFYCEVELKKKLDELKNEKIELIRNLCEYHDELVMTNPINKNYWFNEEMNKINKEIDEYNEDIEIINQLILEWEKRYEDMIEKMRQDHFKSIEESENESLEFLSDDE